MSTTTTATIAPTRAAKCKASLTAFFNRVENIFTTVIPEEIKTILPGVLKFIEGIESVIDNATVDTIVESIIPQIGDVLPAIEKVFDEVIADLELVINAENAPDLPSKMAAVADQIALKPAALRPAYLTTMCSEIIRKVSGNTTVTDSELNTLVAFHTNYNVHVATPAAPEAVQTNA